MTTETAALSHVIASGLAPQNIERLSLGVLHASATNPRKFFDPAGIDEMAASIEGHGVKMPLLVRPSKVAAGQYEIVAGERRYRGSVKLVESLAQRAAEAEEGSEEAGRLAALYEERLLVRAIVEDLDDATVLELQLLENLQRKDLRPLEQARGYQALLDLPAVEGKAAYTPEMIARKIGLSVATVLNKLKMLKAPESLRTALEEGKVSERHLALVASIPGVKGREACAKAVLKGDWQSPILSVRDTQDLITREYRQSLKKVAWALEDETLLPEAGACVNCPHFAKKAAEQDPELAGELGNERGQMDPLTCFNPECLGKKNAAAWAQQKARAKEGEVELLPDEQAKKIFPHGEVISSTAPFIKLDDKPGYDITGHYDNGKTPTWRQILQKQEGLKITMANTVNGPVEIVDKKQAIELAKQHPKHGKLFAHAKASGGREKTDEEKKEAEKRGFEMKVGAAERIELLRRLRDDFLGKHAGVETSLAVLEAALYEAGQDGNKLLCDFLQVQPEAPKKKGEKLNQGHYRACIVERLRTTGAGKREVEALIMLAVIAKWVKAYGLEISSLEPLMKHFGFTKKEITSAAAAAVRAEVAAKKAKAKDKAKGEGQRAKGGKNSVDPVDVSSKKEAGKTAAADKRAKGKAKGEGRRAEGGAEAYVAALDKRVERDSTVTFTKESELGTMMQALLRAREVPVTVPNEHGMFVERTNIQYQQSNKVVFVVRLATTGDGSWYQGYECSIDGLSAFALPGHKVYVTRAAAVEDSLRIMHQDFSERVVDSPALDKARQTAVAHLEKLQGWAAEEAQREGKKNAPEADKSVRAPLDAGAADVPASKVPGVPDEVLGFPSMFKVAHVEAAAAALKAGTVELEELLGAAPDVKKEKKAYQTWASVRGRVLSLAGQ